jgi:flagellin
MALTINSNIASLDSQRNLNRSQAALNISLQRLSSGLRINGSKDDAAGLAISTSMTSQISGLDQGTRNANDGISLLQTADSAYSQATEIVQRMRQLAVQAANGTLQTSDRANLNTEFSQLTHQLSNIARNTQFNGVSLLNGAQISFNMQIGANAGDTIQFIVSDATASTFGVMQNAQSIGTRSGASGAISALDSALKSINSSRANLGASINRLSYVVSLNQITSNNLSAARSQIQDVDFAAETANLTKNNILQQAGTAILAQANALPQAALSLLR